MRPEVSVDATDGDARALTITTPRGVVETPCFMPVGTRAAVRYLTADDLGRLGAQIVLANTYHLMLRPGSQVIAELGGLHRFTDWPGHFLTDSGGYQVFSLAPKVDDEGAHFTSTYDGSKHLLTPESAVDEQRALGADIQMVLDVCPALPATDRALRDAVDRTVAWARRGRDAFLTGDHEQQGAQFGIVQGGTDAELRRESAERTLEIGFDGYALGGLSVGEDRSAMVDTIAATVPHLPADQVRYLMGVGDPIGLIEGVAQGIDIFDCVLPTRLARHGTALSWHGRLNLKNQEFIHDDQPIDPLFVSPHSPWSRAYVRHLINTSEPSAARIVTLHNLAWLLSLMSEARRAIAAGTFDDLRHRVRTAWPDRNAG